MTIKALSALTPLQTYILVGVILIITIFITGVLIHYYRKKQNDPRNYKPYTKKEVKQTKEKTHTPEVQAETTFSELEENDPRYEILRAYILTYQNIEPHKTWKYERFKLNNEVVIKFRLQGKTRRVYFNLTEKELEDTPYNLLNESHIETHKDTPMMFRITGNKGLEDAKTLIDLVLTHHHATQDKKALEDFKVTEVELLEKIENTPKIVQNDDFIDEVKKEPEDVESINEELLESINEEVFEDEVLEEPIVQEEPMVDETQEDKTLEEIQEEEETLVEPVIQEVPHLEPVEEEKSYNYSFHAKIVQANDETKERYTEIRSLIENHEGIKTSETWSQQSFLHKGKTIAKIRVSGKTINLYLNLDPNEYANTKYKIQNQSEVKAHQNTPSLYKVKGSRGLMYAKDLITDMFSKLEVTKESDKLNNYNLEYLSNEDLLEKGFIKETKKFNFKTLE